MKLIAGIIESLDSSPIGKFIVLFYSGMIGATVSYYTPIEAWIENNGGYIGFTTYAIFFDFLLGLISGIVKARLSFKDLFSDLGVKLLAVFGFGILFEGVRHIHNTELIVTDSLIYTVRMMVFLYPVFSASKRMSDITGGVFPPIEWFEWMDSIKASLKKKKGTDKRQNFNDYD